jgi:TonB family protein
MEPRTALVLEEKEHHDPAVKRFQSLCDMHRIGCGEAGNLPQFVNALKQNRHFAMDFWAMVGDLSARERGTLSDDELLAMIVEGSSGRTISELPLNEKVATAELKNMLAGVDVDAPLLEEPRSAPPVEASSEPVTAAEEEVDHRVEAILPAETSRSAGVSETKRSVEEALRRLEETSRELRDQLAALTAMDQLRSKGASAEPEPAAEKESDALRMAAEDSASSATTDQTPPFGGNAPVAEDSSPDTAPLPPQEPVLAARVPPRLIEEREVFASPQFSTLSHRGYTPRDLDDDPSIPVPLAEYAEENPRRMGAGTILLILLLVALAAGGYALHLGYGREQVDQAKTAFLHKLGLFGEEVHDLATPAAQSANKPQPAPAPDQEPATAQQPSRTNEQSQPVPSAQQQNPVPPQESPASPRAEGYLSSRAAVRPEPMPIEPGAVRVPSSVMQANLLSSRVPVYPESARAMEIEGPVEVEAVISRMGTVQYAHAISGDPHLRAAAEEAVMKWRYKPYVINGTPVQAVTQVRINFRLP